MEIAEEGIGPGVFGAMGALGARPAAAEQRVEKGLKGGALGLISSVVVGVASTAPAYSLAATIGFVVVYIGRQTPIAAILAFVPIFLVSLGYKELNAADPDCGTSFTWASRAFGPKKSWQTLSAEDPCDGSQQNENRSTGDGPQFPLENDAPRFRGLSGQP